MRSFFEQDQILFSYGGKNFSCYISHVFRIELLFKPMFQQLSERASSFLHKQYQLDAVQVDWRRSQEPEHGDISTVVALQLAKQLEEKPQVIATALCEALQGDDAVEKCEVAGAGYVNIWLTPATLIEELAHTREACTAKVKRDEKPVIIEYSQPNIAKPLGAHHLLTTVYGQALVNIYRHLGYPVIAWNYVGDWGTQFGKLAVAVEKWGTKESARDYSIDELLDLYVQFHNEAENDSTLEDAGRAAFRKLEEGDADLRAFWEDVVHVTKAALGGIYERLHVSFDEDKGESFYEDKMDSILEQGKKSGVFVEGEGGSQIVEFPEETNYPPYLVVKSDGATLYSTRDIAQMRYRIDEYNPQEILILTDIAQKLHFQQLKATCEQLQWNLPAFENVLVGRMRFADKSMSTRKGNILKLEEVLNEAVEYAAEVIAHHGDKIQAEDPKELAEMMGVGSVAYGIVSQNRKQDIVFDWEKFLSFDGNSAPYLQYTHARAKSVLDKAGSEGELSADVTEFQLKERVLLGTLLQFASVLEEARASHMPHVLCNYLYALCQDYNALYNDLPILQAEELEKGNRLALTSLTASVLRTGAELLTLRVPDRM